MREPTFGLPRTPWLLLLHTWDSDLLHHPHLHCVVTGGGLSADGTECVSCGAGFFLPVRVLSRLIRRLFLEYLIKAFDAGKVKFFSSMESFRDRSSFLDYLAPSREVEWVIYAKRPFAGPEQVLDTSVVITTGWPFPITGSWTSLRATSPSATRIIATMPSKRR
jgi:Putative transposase